MRINILKKEDCKYGDAPFTVEITGLPFDFSSEGFFERLEQFMYKEHNAVQCEKNEKIVVGKINLALKNLGITEIENSKLGRSLFFKFNIFNEKQNLIIDKESQEYNRVLNMCNKEVFKYICSVFSKLD